MQYKSLSLAVTAALTLAGCGGGSSGDTFTDGGNASGFQQWHAFSINEGSNSSEPIQLTYSLLTIDQGNLYMQEESGTPANEFIMTQNGVYQELGPQNSKYGYSLGTGSLNNLVFTRKPYSPVGSTGLTFTTNLKKIDLGGKNALATLEADDQWLIANKKENTKIFSAQRIAFYNSVKDLSFPSGAYCLQQSTYTNNQENLVLYTDIINSNKKAEFDDFAARFAQTNQNNIFKKTYKDTLAYFDSSDGTDANATQGYAEYKNKYYYGERHLKGIEFSLAQYIQEQKDDISGSLNATDYKLAIQRIESLNNECDWYNDTATQFIKSKFQP